MISLRVFLLRLLLGWWFILLLGLFGIPIWYLIGGWKQSIDCYKMMIEMMWDGNFE